MSVEPLSRRELIALGAASAASLAPGLQAGPPHYTDPDARPAGSGFQPLETGPMELSGKVLIRPPDPRFAMLGLPPFLLQSDRVTGYQRFYLDGDRELYAAIARSDNPYIRVIATLRNTQNTPVLIMTPQSDPVPGALQPLPDFSADVSSDPFTLEEEQTLTELLSSLTRAIYDNPDPAQHGLMLDQLSSAFEQLAADPYLDGRLSRIPFTYLERQDCLVEGVSLWELVGPPGAVADRDACILQICIALLGFLAGLVFNYMTPRLNQAIAQEAGALVQNPQVRTALGRILDAALDWIRNGGNPGRLAGTIAGEGARITAQLGAAILRAIRRGCRWSDAILAASTSAVWIVRVIRALATAISLAHTIYRIAQACLTDPSGNRGNPPQLEGSGLA